MQFDQLKRREFITLLSGAAAWPFAAWAQQQPTMPVIGFLDTRSPQAISERLNAYRQGLKEAGYIEGENVAIVYRFAENQVDRLPELAGDLVRREVTVIATAGDDVALAAKQATKTIPIVFIASQDPVRLGLVASLARPDGNLTGVNFFSGELVAKRLEILRELVPRAVRVAVLVNPAYAAQSESALSELQPAARSMGLQMQILNAGTRQEIDATFAIMGRERPDALFVSSDTFFTSRRVQLVSLAMRYAIPTAFPNRESTEIGGLMSYGTSILDAWRQSGSYAGRILRGAKPADLPVAQSTKFELVINAQTASILGLTVPASLLATADEVIE
jgi:putative tryptophan/tyrosine transport system substrate-binding protein